MQEKCRLTPHDVDVPLSMRAVICHSQDQAELSNVATANSLPTMSRCLLRLSQVMAGGRASAQQHFIAFVVACLACPLPTAEVRQILPPPPPPPVILRLAACALPALYLVRASIPYRANVCTCRTEPSHAGFAGDM